MTKASCSGSPPVKGIVNPLGIWRGVEIDADFGLWLRYRQPDFTDGAPLRSEKGNDPTIRQENLAPLEREYR